MVDRSIYYSIQAGRLTERLTMVRNMTDIIVGYYPILVPLLKLHPSLEQYLQVLTKIKEIRDITIKSQDELDYYVRLLTNVESSINSILDITNRIYPHINQAVRQ